MSEINPYQSPLARVDDMPEPGHFELAGRGARFGAWVIDSALVATLGTWYGFHESSSSGPAEGGYNPAGAMIIPVLLLGLAAVNLVLLYRNGQTVGKRIIGIKIVRPDGERAGLARIFFLRYFVPWVVEGIPLLGQVFFLVDSLFIFREPRRCIHDYMADTIVIKT